MNKATELIKEAIKEIEKSDRKFFSKYNDISLQKLRMAVVSQEQLEQLKIKKGHYKLRDELK